MDSELRESLKKTLKAIVDNAKEIAADYIKDGSDEMFVVTLDNLEEQAANLSAEFASLYSCLALAKKKELEAEKLFEKAEATAYLAIARGNKKSEGEGKKPVETIKREALCAEEVGGFFLDYTNAVKQRVMVEGLVKALETKRDEIKRLSIQNHQMLNMERYS